MEERGEQTGLREFIKVFENKDNVIEISQTTGNVFHLFVSNIHEKENIKEITDEVKRSSSSTPRNFEIPH